jgi:predicted O-methyltransferase YrrM
MPLRLPDVPIPGRVAGGRNAREGYQRGWSLQFNPAFRQEIVDDAVFLRAFETAHNRTVVDIARLMNLFLIIRFFFNGLSSQNIVEFGTYRGGSAMFMASCLKELFPGAHVYALDTFEGMPDTNDVDMHRRGDFGDAQFAEVTAAAQKFKLNNITFVKGRFDETFPGVSGEAKSFGLAHIDCDIYDAVRYCQDAVWPLMCPGGYVAYDDATTASCLGATQAMEELVMGRNLHSEQAYPHFVFRAGLTAA